MGVKKKVANYAMNDEEMHAFKWCVRNGICIKPREIAFKTNKFCIDIETGRFKSRKLIATTPEHYSYYEAQKKAAEYRIYYYNKNENKV